MKKMTCICLLVLALATAMSCSTEPTSLPEESVSVPLSSQTASTELESDDFALSRTSPGTVMLSWLKSDVALVFSNSTEKDIELPTPQDSHCYVDTFWFYTDTQLGWKPSPPLGSFFCGKAQGSSFNIPAGQELKLGAGLLLGSRALEPHDNLLVRAKYQDSAGNLLYVYSDEIESSCNEPLVSMSLMAPPAFTIANLSGQEIWLAPPCASIQWTSGWIDEFTSSLQMLNDAQSWSHISPLQGCENPESLIKVVPGETRLIDSDGWFKNAEISLSAGTYRWDIIFYLEQSSYGVADGRHLFSEVFVLD